MKMNHSEKPSQDQIISNISIEEKEVFNDYLIITTVNKNYLRIFDIWWYYFQKTKYKSILRVITLDKESERHVSGKEIETIPIGKSSRNFSKIILWRFEVIHKLLKQGKKIIHSDADALWINPQLEKLINKKYDIQVSISYGIPVEAVSNWGFTLCTGFIIFQSNQKVFSFVEKWIECCARLKDDQISFNNLLLENGIRWELSDKSKNQGYSKNYDLKVEALRFDVVSRQAGKNLFIYHPYLPSNHQNFKVIDLIKRLKKIDNSPYLDNYLKSTIMNPIGWINTTYGWAAIVFHKAVKKITEKISSFSK